MELLDDAVAAATARGEAAAAAPSVTASTEQDGATTASVAGKLPTREQSGGLRDQVHGRKLLCTRREPVVTRLVLRLSWSRRGNFFVDFFCIHILHASGMKTCIARLKKNGRKKSRLSI